jgi:hypothetical protein
METSERCLDPPNQKLVMDEPKLNVTAGRWLHCSDGMSALPPKADIAACDRHVRFVPLADMQLETRSGLERY